MPTLTDLIKESLEGKLSDQIRTSLETEDNEMNESKNSNLLDLLKKICKKPGKTIYNKVGDKTGAYFLHYPKNNKHPEIYWICLVDCKHHINYSFYYDVTNDQLGANNYGDQEPCIKRWPTLSKETPDKGGIDSFSFGKSYDYNIYKFVEYGYDYEFDFIE